MKVTREVEINGEDHDVEIEITEEDVIEFISDCTGRERQRIHDEAIDNGADPKDTELDDIEEFIEDADQSDLRKIRSMLNMSADDFPIKIETLADEMKIDFIASIWEDFTLEQMEKKLKEKSNKVLSSKRK